MRKKIIYFILFSQYAIASLLFCITLFSCASSKQLLHINSVYVEFALSDDPFCVEFNNGSACWKFHIEGENFATVTNGTIDNDWELHVDCEPTIDKSVCDIDIRGAVSTIDCLIDDVPIGSCEVAVSSLQGVATFACIFKPTPGAFEGQNISGRQWPCQKM